MYDIAAATDNGAQRAGLQNFRDLGGIATAAGERIRHGVIYRSDAPRAGDPAPGASAWPPATVIDLRSVGESEGPHPLSFAGSAVHAISLLDEANIVTVAEERRALPDGLPALYRRAITGAGVPLATVVRITSRSSGPTLLHCTVGKDRTGLAVAVILSALGVPDDLIVADYVRTEANVPRVLARLSGAPDLEAGAELVERLARERPDVLTAPAGAMTAALEALRKQGGAAVWLTRHGVAAEELSALRERLVEDAS